MSEKALKELQHELGDAVTTKNEVCFAASYDNMRLSFLPEAVVRPQDKEAVAILLRLANQHKIPVTTRGAGSGTTGAAVPLKKGWVLDLSHWEKIHLDIISGFAYVQPGCRTADIQKEAEKQGWFYPPDPSSLHYCTIGGNIATNAGGMRGAKYGVTRDYVYALEGFLPTGQPVRWGMDLKKFASGYNIRDLWIGSEGTLGIITQATLKLIPKPPDRWTALFAFKNENDALHTVKALLKQHLVPSILEFLDRQTVRCTQKLRGEALFPQHPDSALLLIELDGYSAQVQIEKEKVLEQAGKRALAYKEASTPKETESLWEVRRTCSQAMFQMGNSKLNEDIVVPLDKQTDLLQFTRKLKSETGLATPTFGHAADGNFHVNLMFNRENKEQVKRAAKAVQSLMEKVIELGGAITGEHGIGLAKASFLTLQHNPAEIETMKAIKKVFDPDNILNPGKIFEPFEVWEHEPVKVTLPWDPPLPPTASKASF